MEQEQQKTKQKAAVIKSIQSDTRKIVKEFVSNGQTVDQALDGINYLLRQNVHVNQWDLIDQVLKDEKFKKSLGKGVSPKQSDRDAILERLDTIREQATSRVVDRGLVTWDNENDPRRKQIVNELKKEVKNSVGSSLTNLSPADRNYIINELNNRIESNL
jgi:hypothetical protein